jgi:hypothetical protein
MKMRQIIFYKLKLNQALQLWSLAQLHIEMVLGVMYASERFFRHQTCGNGALRFAITRPTGVTQLFTNSRRIHAVIATIFLTPLLKSQELLVVFIAHTGRCA